ncbi:PREDICTED: protein BIG GRAIN 1-like B [Camelina sativa]|uniref:Protein BIG GRAIN 1-like B n=1 Tax=Camelina sativa TaxID=90675 RepID=A0ABM0YHU7_CAMSA|nr:PREDICTED: protein BIG GRAIN 1-like B [Camelina sativa]
MDPWEPLDHHHHRHLRNHRHPSFSSSLLDQIYRSIDDSSPNSSSMRKTKHQNRDETTTTARVSSSSNRRATAAADGFIRSRNLKKNSEQEPVFFKLSSTTTSTSSDSSGGFSSSESESLYRRSKSSPAIHSSSHHHPKPIRTTVVEPNNTKKQEHGGSFLKTKSKALRIYTDLKKVKQPISPGGRLATFLNSIFTGAGNTKKLNKINTTTVNSAAAASSTTTTCSSASSFSRSCLSKTPSSSEKSKRSVRFCPVNVIFDEDSSNSKYNNNKREYDESTRHHRNYDTLEIRVMEENRRVIEAAKELLRTYQKSNKDVVKISGDDVDEEEEEDEDDDDDALSCTSSDLFELDNLSAIGIDRYREELPVYETTRLNTNRIVSR